MLAFGMVWLAAWRTRAPTPSKAPEIHCGTGLCGAAPEAAAAAVIISSVLPSAAPISGGTFVQLRGAGFRDWDRLMRCTWLGAEEEHRTPARASGAIDLHSAPELECATPRLLMASELQLRLELGELGPDIAVGDGAVERARPISDEIRDLHVGTRPAMLASSAVAFRLYDPPEVRSVEPAEGPAAGGTLVTVHGAGFDGNPAHAQIASCAFGGGTLVGAFGGGGVLAGPAWAAPPFDPLTDALHTYMPRVERVQATVVNAATMLCVAPAAPTRGRVRVEVRAPHV